MVDKKIIKISQAYLRELVSKGIEISHAFLYGSHSKGTAADDSDIDLLIVSPLFDKEVDVYLPKIWLSEIRTKNRIEPYLVGQKRFLEDDMSPLIQIVRKEGLAISLAN